MLLSFKVKKLVIAAIPTLVETWTEGFGFIPVEDDEKKSLHRFNLMVFPGTILLKKALYSSGQNTEKTEGKYHLLLALDSSAVLIKLYSSDKVISLIKKF